MTFRIAFFKGTEAGLSGFYNRVIRVRGRGPYSHVELGFSDGMAASSSFADGGVRIKPITFTPDAWDVVELPAAWEPAARTWFEQHQGAAYNLMGDLFLAIGFVRGSRGKWFCSQAAGAALGLLQSFRFEPNTLYPTILRIVDAYKAAQVSMPTT